MASSNELYEFVGAALGRGASRQEVQGALQQAGWSRDQVHGALTAYADVAFVVPVPKPRAYLSAREAFLYLLLFSTLYIVAFNAGVLLFQFIDYAFPDPALRGFEAMTRPVIRWALASLIVAFPVFLYLSAIVERGVRQDPVKQRSSVRRWLMYLTVFAASTILIGDVITLVYNGLGGELTTRFVLRVLAIAAIAGTILGYYLADLRLEDTRPAVERPSRRVVAAAVVITLVMVTATGLVLIGSPANERARTLDAKRVDDLRQIAVSADNYYERHGRLPASLDELSREGGMALGVDQSTAGRYDYRVSGEKTYELCATFQRDSSERAQWAQHDPWAHRPGRSCFQLSAKDSD